VIRQQETLLSPPHPDSSGTFTVNITNILNINVLSNETLPPDLTDHLINYMRDTIKDNSISFDYMRAMKWITELHHHICTDKQNLNVKLPNIKSMTADVFTPHGWITRHTDEIIDQLLKVRSGQLIDLKDSMNIANPLVLHAPTVKRTMSHVRLFNDLGLSHTGVGDQTRLARGSFKVALLEK